MDAVVMQVLCGLAAAPLLFLVAAGPAIICGVARIVNSATMGAGAGAAHALHLAAPAGNAARGVSGAASPP